MMVFAIFMLVVLLVVVCAWCAYRADMSEPLTPNFIAYPMMVEKWRKQNNIKGRWEIIVETNRKAGQRVDYTFEVIPPEGVELLRNTKGSGYGYSERKARRKAINIAKLRIMNYVKVDSPAKTHRVKI